MIDDGLYDSIKRRTDMAMAEGVEYLIYEIGTYGGLVKSADDISKYFIHEVNKKAHTVAYVATEAISAGAMISVSCEDVLMDENATIGCSAPVVMGGKLEGEEREKMESFVRVTFERAAEANNYPEVILQAMVTMQIEVYRVRNIWTGEKEFFDGEKLPRDENNYDLENKELIVKKGELLTLTASKALDYGVARGLVKDRQGALDFLEKRDGVVFEEEPMVLYTIWSEELVRWINSPTVMGILVMLAMLGVYMELNTPGVGLPGLVALICVVIIIGSKYIGGLANWLEIAMFVIGVALLVIEIFVLPGFGIAGTLGILFIFMGIFGMLVKNPPERLPWPESTMDWDIFANGVWGLLLGVAGFGVLAALFAKYMSKMKIFSGLMLAPASAKAGTEFEISQTAPPKSQEKGLSVGDRGVVLNTLRPAGKVRFVEAIVDCIAQAEFLDKGTEVEIIEIRGNRVVVKAIEI
jgi:membrane-bound serine protease (ClpP class)